MKFTSLFVIAILLQNFNVKCNFFSQLSAKFTELTSSFTHTVENVWNTIGGQSRSVRVIKKFPLDEDFIREKLKLSFHDFVERTVANTYNDEDNKDFANMRTEPTALMSTQQLATLHGRRVESHVIKTRDGYLLSVHRLVSVNKTSGKHIPVLLSHGLLGSSADWIMLGPEKSLPYILSDAGYDVWMTNARGNYYSRGHVSMSVKSPQFWKFSFQEMGQYDLPAIIDYVRIIRNDTNEIKYIGHSMGATALMVLLSTNPHYNEYISIGILLAPLVFMNNVQGPLKFITTMSKNPPEQLLKTIGDTEFLPSRKIPKMISKRFCSGREYYCSNPLLFFAGALPDDGTLGGSFLARLLYHVPAGSSTNTIMHYGQLVRNGKFHKFNRENSEFPLHQVTTPLVLFSSSDDWLATVPDVLRLYFSISNPIDHYVIRDKNMSHTEFVWGVEANTCVFPKVIEYLENGLFQDVPQNNEV